MSKSKGAAVASQPVAGEVARAILAAGNAADAVVAGVLAAAAEEEGVLLGPLQVLGGGAGAGRRAIDGRLRQPGKGAPRPRGFKAEGEVPQAARVGVPALPAALATLLAGTGSLSMAHVTGPALELSRASPARGRVIERMARRGPA